MTAAGGYESYTSAFRLTKIERQVQLLERLADVGTKVEVKAQPELQKILSALRSDLSNTATPGGEYVLLPWAKRVLPAAAAWVLLALFLLLVPQSHSKAGASSMLLGMFACALPFVLLAAFMPTFEASWINYWAYPIGHIVLVITLIMLWQRRKQQRLRQALTNPRTG